jgi:hypothetical protein
MGVNASIEGSNPSFSVRHGGTHGSPVSSLLVVVRRMVVVALRRERGLAPRAVASEPTASGCPERAGGARTLRYAVTPSEGWQSGRMRRSRKPFRASGSDEGSNPSPSASRTEALVLLHGEAQVEAGVPRHQGDLPSDLDVVPRLERDAEDRCGAGAGCEHSPGMRTEVVLPAPFGAEKAEPFTAAT